MAEYVVVIQGDTNDADNATSTNTLTLDGELLEAGYLWPSQPPITHRAFFAALAAGANASAEEHGGHNWANEYSDDAPKLATLTHMVTAFGCPEAEAEAAVEVMSDVVSEFLPRTADLGIHTIASIVATPVAGSITFL